jgi:hypothetical protein
LKGQRLKGELLALFKQHNKNYSQVNYTTNSSAYLAIQRPSDALAGQGGGIPHLDYPKHRHSLTVSP